MKTHEHQIHYWDCGVLFGVDSSGLKVGHRGGDEGQWKKANSVNPLLSPKSREIGIIRFCY